MRWFNRLAILLAVLVMILVVTRDSWMPSDWDRDWHHAWLISPRFEGDAKQIVLQDHERRVNRIKAEYRQRIEAEKRRNRQLRNELEELKKTRVIHEDFDENRKDPSR